MMISGVSVTPMQQIYSVSESPVKQETAWKINTSNPGKLTEFERLFHKFNANISSTRIDLKEIKADPISVAVHKASQVDEGVLVEDTSLNIEGADVGINVRWLMDHLPEYAGRKASWVVLLACRKGEEVYVYEGKVEGSIVLPRGEGGFGFDPVFLPDGASQTLAQDKPDTVNARAKAVESFLTGEPIVKKPPITNWEGEWQ